MCNFPSNIVVSKERKIRAGAEILRKKQQHFLEADTVKCNAIMDMVSWPQLAAASAGERETEGEISQPQESKDDVPVLSITGPERTVAQNSMKQISISLNYT